MTRLSLEERIESIALASRLSADPIEGPLPSWAAGVPEFEPYRAADREDLESDYLATFELGPEAEFLATTGYLRDRPHAWGEELAKLAGFYRLFGVEATRGERPDHLAVQLEFYAFLLAKEHWLGERGDTSGVEVVRGARRRFLEESLAPLALAVAERDRVRQHPIFGPVFGWIGRLVAQECDLEHVQAVPFQWRSGPQEAPEVRCAAPADELVRLGSR